MRRKVISVIAAAFVLVSLTGCKSLTATTEEVFNTAATTSGLKLLDAKEQFEAGDPVSAVIAYQSEMEYQVEFYAVSTIEQAKSAFELNRSTFAAKITDTSTEVKDSGKNYELYTLNTGTEYMVVSRIDNTFVYADVDAQYAEDVMAFIQSLGYLK